MNYRIYNALVASVMNALNMGAKNLLFLLINLVYRWGLGTAPALWVDVVRTSNLAGSYSNGTSGVGATYTTSAAYTSQDSVTLTVGMLVGLFGQSTGAQNGLYKVTSIGSTTVLTRFAGWDASAEMIAGSVFYVRQGTTNGGKVYAYTGSSAPTVGVTSLTFAEDRLLRSAVGATITGSMDLSGGTLVLPQGTAAAPTAEGSIAWDTDDNLLKVGDGASTKVMLDTTSAQAISTGAKDFGAGTLKVDNDSTTNAHTMVSQATQARTWTLPDVSGAPAQAGAATGAPSATAAPTFTGTASTAAEVDAFTGTGFATAGQVVTTSDNQTMTLNQCAGMWLITATQAPCLIASNTAVTGAPAVLTVFGLAPTTAAEAYRILKSPTPAGTISAVPTAAHTHTQT